MSRIRCIVLPNPGPVLSTFVCVHHTGNEQEWDITNIELYADVECTKLLADDIRVDQLPRDTQETIYASLEAYVSRSRRERGMLRLWNADQAAQMVLEGARA